MNTERLLPILQRIATDARQKEILVIGDLILDQYVEAKSGGRLDGAGYDIALIHDNPKFAGGAGNVATNISGLHAQVTLIGIVGDDAAAGELTGLLTAAGVRCELLRHSGWKVPKKVRLTVNGKKIHRVDTEETDQRCDARLEERLLQQIQLFLPKHDLVVVSDYHKGALSPGLIEKISHECGRLRKTLILAPKPRPHGVLQGGYDGAYLMAINLLEAIELSRSKDYTLTLAKLPTEPHQIENDPRLLKLIQEVHEKYKPRNLMVTLSERGVLYRVNNGAEHVIRHVPTRACTKSEVTGAGDTMIAAYAVGLAVHGQEIDQLDLALLGNFAGTYAVEQKHTTIVRLADLLEAAGLAMPGTHR
jgi:rfaE bifunctional protein kinase chain/domain